MSDKTLAGVPAGPVAVPNVVRALAGEGTISPVWTNELGGLTFRIDDSAQRRTTYANGRRRASQKSTSPTRPTA
ncbi:MAG TPA: hypothetical protein VGE11_02190 [Pseudonocardia sp.]